MIRRLALNLSVALVLLGVRVYRWSVALLAVVMLAALPVSAQVSSVCGAGKTCTVRKVLVKGTGGPNLCDDTTNAGWSWYSATSNFSAGWTPAGSACNGTFTQLLNLNLNDALVRSSSAGGFSAGSSGFLAPLAFASFPTCNGTTQGHLLFDTTGNVWRNCDGTTWQAVTSGTTTFGAPWYSNEPASLAASTNWLGAHKPTKGNAGSVVYLGGATTEWATAGTGGTTGVTLAVYDVTSTATLLCTLGSVPCTTAARTPVAMTGCNASFLSTGKVYAVRVSATDCTTQPINASTQIEIYGLTQ
jgi:hypothetical protein